MGRSNLKKEPQIASEGIKRSSKEKELSASFPFIFTLYKQKSAIVIQINVKVIHLVCSAWNRTHDFLIISLLYYNH